MVEFQLPKLTAGVRFPSPAPFLEKYPSGYKGAHSKCVRAGNRRVSSNLTFSATIIHITIFALICSMRFFVHMKTIRWAYGSRTSFSKIHFLGLQPSWISVIANSASFLILLKSHKRGTALATGILSKLIV